MTDLDPEDYPAPQTPTRDARAEPHHSRHRRYDVSTCSSSPSISPSPSLSFLRMHPLGMSPFSPLSRQFSSPFAAATSPARSVSEELGPEEDLTQDSKDVLIQRLNDLATRLNHQDLMTEGNVLSLHSKVDEMESLLATHYHPLKSKSPKPRPSSSALGSSKSEVASPRRPSTPSQVTSDKPSHMQPPSAATTNGGNHDDKQAEPEHLHAPKMSPAEAERVVAEAQLLHKGLEEVIANLRARQEESDHIHDLLITRAERAAQRIIFLERRLKELERNEGEMEMLNLQIQLKAIEVQCLSYVPKDADHDLRESISAWKMEWSALKRRRAKNRGSIHEDFNTPPRRMFSSPD